MSRITTQSIQQKSQNVILKSSGMIRASNTADSGNLILCTDSRVYAQTQFSSRKPSTRLNSLELFVTTTKPMERAWPAII
jgi:hypothetical protein